MKTLLVPLMVVIAFCCTLLTPSAFADLGGNSESIDKDRSYFHGTRRQTESSSQFQISEINNGATTIKEFLTNKGVVFAIAWKGRSHPDLQRLLGNYFSDFKTALQAGKSRKRHVRRPYKMTKGAQVTVEQWGHFGAIQGRSYVSALVPAGVNSNDIR